MLGWRQHSRQFVIVVAVVAASAMLSGCAGDAASLLTSSAAVSGDAAKAGPTDTAGATDTADITTGASSDKPGFNPFSQVPETASAVREVIQNPSRAEIMKAGPLPEFVLGRADAPVTIVKYMSLTCPYCRRFQADVFPILKRDYIDKGHVRLVFREFPIGRASGTATIALRCAPIDKYLALYEKLLAQQSAWVAQDVKTDAILKVAQQVGMTGAQLESCLKNQAMIDVSGNCARNRE